MPQIVLDTNVLVSGVRSRRGAAYQVLTLVGRERFQTHVSVPLVFEYEDALARHRASIPISDAAVEAILDYHCAVAERHEIYFLWRPLLKDPKDDLVLELAVKARCDFIVTHNTRDFAGSERLGVHIVTPGEFLRHLGIRP